MPKKERLSEAVWSEARQHWCCRVLLDGKRRAFYSSIPGRRGKREAENKADAWVESGSKDSSARFGTLWADFIDYEKRIRGDKNCTYRQRESCGRLYILPHLEHKKLDALTPLDWQNCISETYAKSKQNGRPLSAKTLKNIRSAITAFRNYEEAKGIDVPSLRHITIPQDAPIGERRILQPDDLRKLFSDPQPTPRRKQPKPHYLHAWRLQVITGLRPGEVYALQWDDISADGILSVRRSVNYHGVITGGKNLNARRSFLLPCTAIAELDAQREYLKSVGIISPYVFPSQDGSIAQERSVYQAWTRYCQAQGISRCSLYELRHTMISMSTDVPDALLKPMVGHSKNMDTRGIYGHDLAGNRERTASMLEETFDRLIGDTC